eukprot:2151096-Lingulodinium_polyedra.AAC.1
MYHRAFYIRGCVERPVLQLREPPPSVADIAAWRIGPFCYRGLIQRVVALMDEALFEGLVLTCRAP